MATETGLGAGTYTVTVTDAMQAVLQWEVANLVEADGL
jgi:hypothetical protein